MSAFDDQFPAASVLLDRGRYATLGSQKRNHLKLLRDDCETLSDCARHILNGAQHGVDEIRVGEPGGVQIGLAFARAEMGIAEERLRAAKLRVAALVALEPQLAALKPLAWGKAKTEEAE